MGAVREPPSPCARAGLRMRASRSAPTKPRLEKLYPVEPARARQNPPAITGVARPGVDCVPGPRAVPHCVVGAVREPPSPCARAGPHMRALREAPLPNIIPPRSRGTSREGGSRTAPTKRNSRPPQYPHLCSVSCRYIVDAGLHVGRAVREPSLRKKPCLTTRKSITAGPSACGVRLFPARRLFRDDMCGSERASVWAGRGRGDAPQCVGRFRCSLLEVAGEAILARFIG